MPSNHPVWLARMTVVVRIETRRENTGAETPKALT